MHPPQPDLKMSKGTVPAEKLYYKCKDYPADMDPFDPFMPPAYECPKDQKNYPEEVKNDCKVRGDLVKHILLKQQT